MKIRRARMVMGTLFAVAALTVSAIVADTVFAHCDTMNGPIIPEAKAALEKCDVTPILKWVKKENEAEIKQAFAEAVAVRAKGPEPKEMADRYFVETLVRLHRAGEGAPYSGIKDEPVEPIVAIAEKALRDGSPEEVIMTISDHMAEAIREKFNKATTAKKDKDKSVETGREFVDAYVTYMHFVEGIHAAILSSPTHHRETPGEAKAKGEGDGEHKH